MINMNDIIKERQEADNKAVMEQSKKYGLDIRQFLSFSEVPPYGLIWDNKKINAYLKKCPFCGGVAEIIDYEYDDGLSYAIECTNCNAETDEYDERVEAIIKWNQRV